MTSSIVFNDLLEIRRKDCDFLWVSRHTEPLLPHNLPPESRYSRNKIIETVLKSPRVKLVVESLARQKHIDETVIESEARSMANEMASKAHLPTVRWIGFIMTKVIKRIFQSIYLNESFLLITKNNMRFSGTQYVYAPSHRSYLDFILLSYILFSYDMALPNIASGMDFYQMFIVGELLRKTGAFYMRRSFSNDQLYKEVFRAYINSIVSHSDRAIEFFIEGTRSRSQKSITPKCGLLSMMLESLQQGNVSDIQFVPISISYDRPPEELLFVYELLGVPKPKETTTGLFKSLSILQKPQSHGLVFFNIANPISASQFINQETRREKILNPDAKIPTHVVENLAYSIIECHQANTVLSTINIIALLFNEKVQNSVELYTLDELLEDYYWCKKTLIRSFNANVHPSSQSLDSKFSCKHEVMEAMKTHEDLLEFDSSQQLLIKQRHKEIQTETQRNVKGHSLSEETKEFAVSAINIFIYINPTLSILIKPAMIVTALAENNSSIEKVFKRYHLLRTILSTEFALPTKIDETYLEREYKSALDILLKEDCLNLTSDTLSVGKNIKLFSLLQHLIIPFLDAIRITYNVLYEWCEPTSGSPTERKIIIESQKLVEKALLENIQRLHPYSLCLDLYVSTLNNLVGQDIAEQNKNPSEYNVGRTLLRDLIVELDNIPIHRPSSTYLDALPLFSSQGMLRVQAKL